MDNLGNRRGTKVGLYLDNGYLLPRNRYKLIGKIYLPYNGGYDTNHDENMRKVDPLPDHYINDAALGRNGDERF